MQRTAMPATEWTDVVIEAEGKKKFQFGMFRGATYETAAKDETYVKGLMKTKRLAKFEQEFLDWYHKAHPADHQAATAGLKKRLPTRQEKCCLESTGQPCSDFTKLGTTN